MSKTNNSVWFFIVAKDGSCRGYIPAQNKEEACEKFGLKPEECSVKRVSWTKDGFIEAGQSVQEKLL